MFVDRITKKLFKRKKIMLKFNWKTQLLLIGIITVKNKSIFRTITSTAFQTIHIKMLLSIDTRIREATSMIGPRHSDTYIVVFYLLILTY